MYKDQWQTILAHDLADPEGWNAVDQRITREGVFGRWDRLWTPGGAVENYFNMSFAIALGDFDHPLVAKFLDYGKQVCNRAESEHVRWSEDGDWGRFISTKADFLSSKMYLNAWLEDRTPETVALAEYARLVEHMSRSENTGRLWQENTQTTLLSSVQSALLADDLVTARKLMKLRKTFKYTRILREWTENFVNLVAEPMQNSGEIENTLRTLFDTVRAPAWRAAHWKDEPLGFVYSGSVTILRIQLALLVFKFVKNQKPTWREVIELIAD